MNVDRTAARHPRTARFYDRLAFLYPLINRFLKGHKRRLAQEVNALPPGRLLEVGVGQGTHLHLYRGHGLTGIDLSESMLRVARAHAPEGTALLQMDGAAMSFGAASFDYVLLCHVIAVADDPEALLRECRRVLKPGGTLFLLNHFTPRGPLGLLDRAFAPLGRLLHFRSSFPLSGLRTLESFIPVKGIALGKLSYFKLLIYRRP